MFQFGLFTHLKSVPPKHIKSILIVVMSLCPCIDLKSINITGGQNK